jgi:hypothetical protein
MAAPAMETPINPAEAYKHINPSSHSFLCSTSLIFYLFLNLHAKETQSHLFLIFSFFHFTPSLCPSTPTAMHYTPYHDAQNDERRRAFPHSFR